MLKISEIFYSFQGEGLRMGRPSIFIRLFGCNLTCPGFSNPELGDIPVHNVATVSDITGDQMMQGCDSVYAWKKDYEHLSYNKGPLELYEYISELLGSNNLTKSNIPVDIVFTGGEPLMQQSAICEFLEYGLDELDIDFNHITFETNGSIPVKRILKCLIEEMDGERDSDLPSVGHFSISPKLSASGEPFEKTHTSRAADSFKDMQRTFKYVVDPTLDKLTTYGEIDRSLEVFNEDPTKGNIYLMPVGATLEQQNETLPQVAEMALMVGYNVSVRAHIYAFGNGAGV